MEFPEHIVTLIDKYNILVEELDDSTVIEVDKKVKKKDKIKLEKYWNNLIILRKK